MHAMMHVDVVRSLMSALMLDDSCHERINVIWKLSLVCKSTAQVMSDPFFVANVWVPWITPYRVLLNIPHMDMHHMLIAVKAHATHAGLLTTAFIELVGRFRVNGYYNSLHAADVPGGFMVQVVSRVMAKHPTSPVVLHLACMVLAYYCDTKHVLYTEIAQSGVLPLAVEAEYKYCADAVGSYPGFQTLLKAVQHNADTQRHVVRARAGRLPPPYAMYTHCHIENHFH